MSDQYAKNSSLKGVLWDAPTMVNIHSISRCLRGTGGKGVVGRVKKHRNFGELCITQVKVIALSL